jgi:hypothetical protein
LWRISEVVTAIRGIAALRPLRRETLTSQASAPDDLFTLDMWTNIRVGASTPRTGLDRRANRARSISDRVSVVAAAAGP